MLELLCSPYQVSHSPDSALFFLLHVHFVYPVRQVCVVFDSSSCLCLSLLLK